MGDATDFKIAHSSSVMFRYRRRYSWPEEVLLPFSGRSRGITCESNARIATHSSEPNDNSAANILLSFLVVMAAGTDASMFG
jgi:hypothetical protein